MLAVEMLTEHVHVPDIPVSGLAHVEDMGDGQYRLTFYATRQSIHGGTEHTVECRLVATAPAMIAGVKTVMVALGHRCCGSVRALVH